MTIDADLIEDTLLEETTQGIRLLRRIGVKDIDASQKFGYLLRALEAGGVAKIGDKHPMRPVAACQRRLVRSVADGTGAVIELEYSSFLGDVTIGRQETLLVEESTGLTNELVSELFLFGRPNAGGEITGTFTQLKFGYTPSGGNKQIVIGRINKYQMFRTLTVTKVSRTRPKEEAFNCPECVNDRNWMNSGLGYWLCAGAGRAREFEYGTGNEKWWALRATFISRVRRTWAEVDFARDQFGRVFEDADTTPAKNMALHRYEHKLITSNGAMAVGPYALADFKGIFGYDYEDLFGDATQQVGFQF